jgi:hypothetical protein
MIPKTYAIAISPCRCQRGRRGRGGARQTIHDFELVAGCQRGNVEGCHYEIVLGAPQARIDDLRRVVLEDASRLIPSLHRNTKSVAVLFLLRFPQSTLSNSFPSPHPMTFLHFRLFPRLRLRLLGGACPRGFLHDVVRSSSLHLPSIHPFEPKKCKHYALLVHLHLQLRSRSPGEPDHVCAEAKSARGA